MSVVFVVSVVSNCFIVSLILFDFRNVLFWVKVFCVRVWVVLSEWIVIWLVFLCVAAVFFG